MQKDIEYEKIMLGLTIYTQRKLAVESNVKIIICVEQFYQHLGLNKGNYLCTNCDMMFGTWKKDISDVLDIGNNTECPICLEVKHSISQPNCNHRICFDCFKKCYFKSGEDSEEEYTGYIQKCPLCLK